MQEELEIQAKRRDLIRPKTIPRQLLERLASLAKHDHVYRAYKRPVELQPQDAIPKDIDISFPQTLEECKKIPRPCPFVRCKHHNYLEVSPTGGLKINFPELDPEDLPPELSCSLDVADATKAAYEETGELLDFATVGQAMGVSDEQARRITKNGCWHIRLRLLSESPHASGRHTPARAPRGKVK